MTGNNVIDIICFFVGLVVIGLLLTFCLACFISVIVVMIGDCIADHKNKKKNGNLQITIDKNWKIK